jgi:glucose-6-phosphate 3-dehydrogenase
MGRNVKIGIVGAGNVASMHMSAISSIPDATLAGVYDVSIGRAHAVARRLRCPAYESAERLFENVDGVVIASPNHTHAAMVTAAIRSGTHVLCEKPMTTTMAEARQITNLSASSDLVCGMGFNYRYLDLVREVAALLDGGELGTVLFAELSLKRSSALTRTTFTWRDSALGRLTSGALGDLGVHLFDLLRFLFRSEVDTATCRVKRQTNVPEKEGRKVMVDDYSFVTGRLASGTYFNVVASKSSPPADVGLALKLVGERREFSYHSADDGLYRLKSMVTWDEHRLRTSRRLPDPPGEIAGWGTTFHAQLREWTGQVVRREPPGSLATFEDGLRTQEVLDRLIEGDRQPALP